MPRAALSDVTNNHAQRIPQRAAGKTPLLQQPSAFSVLADAPVFKTSCSAQNTAPRGRNVIAVTAPATSSVGGVGQELHGEVGTANQVVDKPQQVMKPEEVADIPQEAEDKARSVLDDTHTALLNCIEELNTLCTSKTPAPAPSDQVPNTVWHDCPESHECPDDAASVFLLVQTSFPRATTPNDAVAPGVEDEGQTLAVAMDRLEDELGQLAEELQLSPAMTAPPVARTEEVGARNSAPRKIEELGAAQRICPPRASRTSEEAETTHAPVTSGPLACSSPPPAQQPREATRSPNAYAGHPVQSSPPMKSTPPSTAHASLLRRELSRSAAPNVSLSAARHVSLSPTPQNRAPEKGAEAVVSMAPPLPMAPPLRSVPGSPVMQGPLPRVLPATPVGSDRSSSAPSGTPHVSTLVCPGSAVADAAAVDWGAPSTTPTRGQSSLGPVAVLARGGESSLGDGAGEDGGKVARWRAGVGAWGGADGGPRWQFQEIGFDVAALRSQLATRNAEVEALTTHLQLITRAAQRSTASKDAEIARLHARLDSKEQHAAASAPAIQGAARSPSTTASQQRVRGSPGMPRPDQLLSLIHAAQ
ncbi:hypothetical protein T484DRAFT_1811520, partial [Baffinella frigidus]